LVVRGTKNWGYVSGSAGDLGIHAAPESFLMYDSIA